MKCENNTVHSDFNKEFRESFKKIALPVGLQNLFFVSLNFIDSLMVGMLGQNEYNAVGLSGQFYFVIHLIMIGISSAVAIYMSQYFGNKDFKGYRKSVGLALISCLTIGLLAGCVSILFPKFIISFFTDEPEIIKEGVGYLEIVGFQIPLMSIILPLSMASRTSKNAKLPLIISFVSLSFNTLLNYLLIFGNFGFTKLGVRGAAYATVISRGISFLLYVIILTTTDNPLRGALKDFFTITRSFIKKVFYTGWTVVLHECLWVVGITIFIQILSKINTDAYTSYQIASQFIRFSMIFTMAVSSSASVTIGGQLGRKDITKALAYEKKYSKAQISIGFVISLLIVCGTYFFVDLFKVSDSIKKDAFYITISLCIFLPLNSYSGMQAAGILRAGGDTKIPVFFELTGIYFVNVPVLFLLLKFTHLPIPVIMFFASMGSILTTILLYNRVKSKKWARNLISEEVTGAK